MDKKSNVSLFNYYTLEIVGKLLRKETLAGVLLEENNQLWDVTITQLHVELHFFVVEYIKIKSRVCLFS